MSIPASHWRHASATRCHAGASSQVGPGITWSRYLIVSVDAKKRFEVRRACAEKAEVYIVSFDPVGA